MSEIEELIGYDIMIDGEGNFVSAPDGDMEIVYGYSCLVQEIKNEMMTQPGELFYDENYGFGLLDFIQAQDTEINRLELTQRIRIKIAEKEFVDPNSVNVDIKEWDLSSIILLTSFRVSDKSIQLNINISDRVNVEVVSG
jgi:hypothetical protein